MTFTYLDWIVVFLYAVVLGTAAFYLIKSSPKTSEGYFLAGRNVRWPFIGASILVSNISTEHFIGLAGLSFTFGWAVASWELIAIYASPMGGELLILAPPMPLSPVCEGEGTGNRNFKTCASGFGGTATSFYNRSQAAGRSG